MELNKNEKITLGLASIDSKIVKVLGYIGILLILFLLLVFNIGFDGNIIIRIIININIFLLFIFMVGILLSVNEKIEIENKTITKTDIFNRKKVLGTISDITTFSLGYTCIYVLNGNQEYFTFKYHGEDNNKFRKILNDNYEKSIYIKGNKLYTLILCFFSLIIFIISLMELGIFTIIELFISFLMMYCGINELKTKFIIINNQIIIKNLISEKKINISDLTTIKYKRKTGYGKYKTISKIYIVSGYINKKRCFSIELVPENLDIIKKFAKENKVKVMKISK